MARVEASVVINRPVNEVWAYASVPENTPNFATGVEERTQTSEGPMGVGATGRDVTALLGRRVESTWEITEWEPEKKTSVKSTSGPVGYEGSFTYESVQGGTKLTVVFEADLRGFFKLAEPIVVRTATRQIESSNETLKDILESRAA